MALFAQPQSRCPTCALKLEDGRCSHCAQNPPPLDACVAAVSYTFPWSECIARFKFQADPGLGRSLAEVMRHAPWVEPALDHADAVIALPLSAPRLRERGFNQAFELARHLAPEKADAHTLRRATESTHQVGAERDARFDNVRDAFWVDPMRLNRVQGQRLVLLDDVMTTGATLFEAARTLRAAGAAHITGMVLARTESRELGHDD
jgi:ComF family protein